MSLFDRLHHYKVNHAVIHNYEMGVSDWFLVCHKQQLRNIHIMINGNYIHNKEEIYIINLKRIEVHMFYELITYGYYKEAYKEITATVWELSDNGFKNYINRKPIRRNKLKNGQID